MLIVTGAGSTRLTNEQCSPNTISYTWDTYSFANAQSRIVKNFGWIPGTSSPSTTR